MDVEVGGTVVFECGVNGRPAPVVRWYHDDELMDCPSGRVGETDEYRLVLERVRLDQGGRYKCVAESPSGRATCLAHLTIRPAAPVTNIEEASFAARKAVFSQSSTVISQESYRSVHSETVTKIKTEMASTTSASTTQLSEEKKEEEEAVLSVKERASLFGGTASPAVDSPKMVNSFKDVNTSQR